MWMKFRNLKWNYPVAIYEDLFTACRVPIIIRNTIWKKPG